ncbi:MAG: TolC family protein [Bacteroidetes bacterium]|nr:TolC family protein [Bacteroidota bacterium]
MKKEMKTIQKKENLLKSKSRKYLIILFKVIIILKITQIAKAEPETLKELEPLSPYFIPSLETIEKNLKQENEQQLKEEIQELQKPNILDFLSSINLTYKTNLINQSHGLIISLNILKLFEITSTSRKYKQSKKKVTFRHKITYQKTLQEISLMIETLKKKVTNYNNQLKIFKLKTSLYNIEKRRYEKGEIPPSEYIKKQITYEYDKTTLIETKKELQILRQKILNKAQGNFLNTKTIKNQ